MSRGSPTSFYATILTNKPTIRRQTIEFKMIGKSNPMKIERRTHTRRYTHTQVSNSLLVPRLFQGQKRSERQHAFMHINVSIKERVTISTSSSKVMQNTIKLITMH